MPAFLNKRTRALILSHLLSLPFGVCQSPWGPWNEDDGWGYINSQCLCLELFHSCTDLVNDNQEKKVSGGGSDGMTSPVSSEEQQLFEKDHQLESTASKEDVAALDQKTNDLKLPLVPDEPGNNLVLSF